MSIFVKPRFLADEQMVGLIEVSAIPSVLPSIAYFKARCPLARQAELLVWHLTIFLDFVNLMNVVDLVDLNFYLNIFLSSQTLSKFCTKVTQFWVSFMAYA